MSVSAKTCALLLLGLTDFANPLVAEREDFFGADRSVKSTVTLDTLGSLSGEVRFSNQSTRPLCAQVIVAFFDTSSRIGAERVTSRCVNGAQAARPHPTAVVRKTAFQLTVSPVIRDATIRMKVRATPDTMAAVSDSLLNKLFP